MQARGVAHFHALMRLDGVDPLDPTPSRHRPAPRPSPCSPTPSAAPPHTRFRSLPHPDQPDGWLIEWGTQLDLRPVGTPSTERSPRPPLPGTSPSTPPKAQKPPATRRHASPATVNRYANQHTHAGRLVDACWRLGRQRRTELRGSTPLGTHARLRRPLLHQEPPVLHHPQSPQTRRQLATRPARSRPHPDMSAHHDLETTLIVGNFTYAGTGWKTIGDALLANTAAAKAREHRQVVKDQLASIFSE